MYRLFQKIQIGGISLTGCISTEITKSEDNFTNTVIITLPNVMYNDKSEAVFIANESKNITALISRDDIVKIWSGYNKTFDELPLRFSGFVVRMEVNEQVTLYCEDYGYVLKNINVPSKTFKDVTIKDIVNYTLQGANLDVIYDDETIQVGDWVIDNNSVINAIEVLEKLEELGLRVYFNQTTLRIGGITDITGSTKNFIIEHNVTENNLIYRNDDNANLVIKGISNLDTNEKIERYAYLYKKELKIDQVGISGETRTFNFYNKSAAELEETLTNNFNKYVYTGYNGTFTTVLEPIVNIDDNVNIYSLKYPENNGNYKVRSIVTRIDINGGFQEIELGQKITSL